jgi:hypothetical protein
MLTVIMVLIAAVFFILGIAGKYKQALTWSQIWCVGAILMETIVCKI